MIDDDNHFRYFAPDPPASMPEGTMEPLVIKTTAERVAERQAWLAKSETCPCCKGLGRVPVVGQGGKEP
jgi:hypothetical protein